MTKTSLVLRLLTFLLDSELFFFFPFHSCTADRITNFFLFILNSERPSCSSFSTTTKWPSHRLTFCICASLTQQNYLGIKICCILLEARQKVINKVKRLHPLGMPVQEVMKINAVHLDILHRTNLVFR